MKMISTRTVSLFLRVVTLSLSVLIFNGSVAQTTVTIGAGAQTGTSSNGAAGDPGPMYRSTNTSSFVYSRHHYLYTAAELSTAGITSGMLITSIAWNKDNNAQTNSPAIFQVWMKNSSKTTVGAGGQLWTDLIANSTQVYNNSAHQVADPPAWQIINFSSPFLYTGGALEISVNFDISAGTSPWTSAGFSWKKDPITDRTLSYVGSAPPGTTLPNLRTVRPQIQITTMPSSPCISPPDAGTIASTSDTVCASQIFTLSRAGGTSGGGQTYTWQSSSDSIAWINIADTLPTINISINQSTYFRLIVTCTGIQDTTNSIFVYVQPILPGGAYTINATQPTGGTNFNSFKDFADRINCGGISGPVSVTVAPGTYTEQVIFKDVPGASAINSITIDGVDAANVILTFNQTNSNERYTMLFDGAKFMTIKNMTIVAGTATYGNVLYFTNNAGNITILDNIILTDTISTSTTNFNGIVASGSLTSTTTAGITVNNLTIKGNKIWGGYYAIRLNGLSGTELTGIVIEDNDIQKYHYSAVYLSQVTAPVISKSLMVARAGSATTSRGIQFETVPGPFQIVANRIHSNHNFGIYINNSANSTSTRSVIVNNMIGGGFTATATTDAGIRLLGTTANIDIFYNSVLFDAGSGAALYIGVATVTGLDVRNNSFAFTGTGAGYAVYYSSTNTLTASDYNNYYSTGANFVYYGAARANLAALQAVNTPTGNDLNSISGDPVYKSSTDLSLAGPLLVGKGTPIASVTTDIFGTLRNPVSPVIGAHEFTPLNTDLWMTSLISPQDNICGDSTTTVRVRLYNLGISPLSNIPVKVDISGAINTSITGTFSGSLLSGQADTFVVGNINTYNGGTYNFKAYSQLSSDQDKENDTILASVIVKPIFLAVGINDSVCAGETAYLSVADTSFKYNWFTTPTGGNPIASGDSLVLPNLLSTATYYVEGDFGISQKVGPPGTSIGTSANFTDPSVQSMFFTVITAVTIDSVLVFPNGSGNVVFAVYNDAGTTLINSVTVPVTVSSPGTPVRIPINMTLPPGNYRLNGTGSTTGGLFRNSTGAVYPYTIPGVISITGNTFDPVYYYYFYDWTVGGGGAGNYCPGPRMPVTAVVASTVLANAGVDTFVCSGSVTLGGNPSATGTHTPFTYSWSPVASLNNATAANPVATPSTTTSYILTVNNTFGCTNIDTVIVIRPQAIVNTAQIINEMCYGANDGAIIITVTGGEGPFSLKWSNGSTGAIVGSLQPGNYQVTITDKYGCEKVENYDVLAADSISISGVITPASSTTSNDGSVSVTTTGGTSPYTYLWSTGATTANLTNIPAGTYSVTVTDANQCSHVQTFVVLVTGIAATPSNNINIRIYPNPAVDNLTVELILIKGSVYSLEILDMFGKVVYSDQGEFVDKLTHRINLNHLATGNYLLQLKVDEGIITQKITLIK